MNEDKKILDIEKPVANKLRLHIKEKLIKFIIVTLKINEIFKIF